MSKSNYITPQGDDLNINLVFLQSDGVTPQDITGMTIKLLLKPDKYTQDDDPSVIEVDALIVSAILGTATISMPSSQTAGLSGSYAYKMIQIDGDGIVKTFAYGVITFSIDGSSIGEATLSAQSALLVNSYTGAVTLSTMYQDVITATAGQTSFPMTYVGRAGTINVYRNGVKMQLGNPGDYQIASDRKSIVFNTGVDLNDKIEIDYIVQSGSLTISTFYQDQSTATGGQTTFTLTYQAKSGTISVFKNGIKMQKGATADYQEGSGLTSIIFNSGLTLNDKVEVNYAIA